MNAPDLTTYRIVHRAMRLAAHRMAAAATGLDASDEPRVEAFSRYWHGYAGEVLCHHRIEDDIFFPALVARVPVAAGLMARTDGEHHRLDELMDLVAAELAAVRHGAPAAELAGYLGELAEHMDQHLGFEDEDVLPLFERHFDAEEYDLLDRQAVKAMGIGRQAAFSVPWIAAAMTDEERTHVLAGAPLPFRLLYRMTAGRFARLELSALGGPEEVRFDLTAAEAALDDAPVITGRRVAVAASN